MREKYSNGDYCNNKKSNCDSLWVELEYFFLSLVTLRWEGIIVPLDRRLLVYPGGAGVDKGASVDEGEGIVCPGGGAGLDEGVGVEEGKGEGLIL